MRQTTAQSASFHRMKYV